MFGFFNAKWNASHEEQVPASQPAVLCIIDFGQVGGRDLNPFVGES